MPKLLTLTFYTTACLFFNSHLTYGQCSGAPCGNPVPQADPMSTCILPNPSELICFEGTTTFESSVVFPAWCGNNINTQWFAFVADATTVSLTITNNSCSQGNTLQAALFSTVNCVNFSIVSNCVNILVTQNGTVNATGLVPGQVYYLCIGGSSGAICEFTINPTGWSGFAANCVLNSLNVTPYTTLAFNATWSVNPPTAAIIHTPSGPATHITWLEPGIIDLCLTSPTCPLYCQTVEVFGGEFEEHVDICPGKTVECAGHTYSAPGTYTFTEPDGPWCDKTTTCYVHLVPITNTADTVFMCQGGTATCAGEEFVAPGNFPVILTGYKGCDSIVTCKINIYPVVPPTNLTINLCGPAEYMVCDNVFNSSGLYSQNCMSWLGCDSIVNLNLAVLDPVALINPPGTLSCQGGTITLNGSGSSVNTAQGGITTYVWSGPGIVGTNNAATAEVNQPGTYCFVVTHARGGVFCRDTACVVVTAQSVVPPLPVINGVLNPCHDSTYIYTATANSTPAPTAFNWTLPGNQSYSTLSLNSIQVTWDTVISGTICVTATNACGTSPISCLPVVVQLPVQQPVMNGPSAVCADGGAYLFVLHVEEPGVTYNWTIPAGAVLTGSGDSVSIDFQNAVSGQVCVTAQNTCGAGLPVCLDVQVNPVPGAVLSSDTQICAGDSALLHFTLTGNGPFDVTWSVNNQLFTYSDIVNGHEVNVSPTQTTIYKIISITDNSSPACTAIVGDSVTVTVFQPQLTAEQVQICAGESVFAGGGLQTVSGIYTDTLQSMHSCDSIIVTTLTVLPIDSTVVHVHTCDPAQAGSVTQILTQQNGCDSVVITVTILQPSDTTYLSASSCNPNNVGVFTQNFSNVFGCDSLVVTTVAFALADTTLATGATCDPAATGVFTQQLTGTDGCDSLVITTVSLLPASTTTLTGTTCNPANAGVFTNILTNYLGCDSTVTTTVTLVPLPVTNLSATTCDPASAGVFIDQILTQGGCDSTVVTTVNLLPSSATTLTATTCNPANAGVFTNILTNYLGCDSTVTTTVTLVPLPVTNLSATTCDPASAGVFTEQFTTQGGCDSIVVTTVNLLPSSATTLTGTTCNPANAGVFINILTNYMGCDSTVTTTISLVPLPVTNLSATTCDPASAGVFIDQFITQGGCDSTVITTVSLLPSSTTTLTGTTCDPAQAGVFVNVLTNYLGCDSTVTTTVTLLITHQTALATTTCDPAQAGVFIHSLVNQFGCDSIVTETRTLLPGSFTTINLTTCDPAQVGSTSTVLPNQYGCDSTIVTSTALLPTNSCSVAVTLTGSGASCIPNSGTITLTPTVGTAPFSYTVMQGTMVITSGTAAALGVPQEINGLPAGNYSLIITSPNGYSATATATVTPAVPPGLTGSVSSDYTGFAVSCAGAADGSASATASGGSEPYIFAWSNGGNTAQISNLSGGVYTVTVTDANGCTNISSVTMSVPPPLEISFVVNDLDCFGHNDGAIQMEVTGGAGPYQYALNNGPVQQADIFTGLKSGVYSLTASDANGCEQTDVIAVNAATLLNVDLGDDIQIGLGESATLQATVNVPFDSILSAVWSPPLTDSTECPAPCLTQTVTPFISTVYTIQVQALNGCTDEDKMTVVVDRRRNIYVPNIFTPNGDGANNLFSIYAKPGTVNKIHALQIFDRWGDAVFTLKDFQPNNPSIGWNGIFNGKPMNPGVFVWVADIEFVDGQREVFKGDVSVVR